MKPHLNDGARDLHHILAQMEVAFFAHYPECDEFIRPTLPGEHEDGAPYTLVIRGETVAVPIYEEAEL
jgi:hypothetical protein